MNMKILESIAKAINESGKRRAEISRDTGIDEAILHRIVNGGSCGMKSTDNLFEYFDLEIKPKKQGKR